MPIRNIYLFLLSSFFSTLCLQGQEIVLSGKGYDMHTELTWESFPSSDRYQLWRKAGNESQFSAITTTNKLRYLDWTGREDQASQSYQYYLKALSLTGEVLGSSDTLNTVVAPFSNEQFLDMVQEYTFRYFYEYAHPTSGMIRERLGSGDIVTSGGSGFGVMALIVGVHRGYITREEAVHRMLKMVSFLQFADRFHGVFPHWMNGKTGAVIPFSTFDNGGDLVETAFLMQGLLCARQYFNQDTETENVLRDVITSLWEDVEWDHYSRNNSGVLYWHWSPNFGWQMNFPLRGYNEGLIVYLLAIASPTHPVDASYWQSGWAGSGYINGNSWYGHTLFLGPHYGGPLFFAHYSYMGFDPRNRKDDYANYFDQNKNHTLINRGWCVANPLQHEGYAANCWGLTASDDPWGYAAHAPGGSTDNGTITPSAAISSMPYTPDESMEALIHFYRTYGTSLWGEYGFFDAFNPTEDWFAGSYLAIDQGPIINMIENYRSALLWTHFMTNPEIGPALESIGFTPDLVTTREKPASDITWNIFPTINQGEIYVAINTLGNKNIRDIFITDALGREVSFEKYAISDEMLKLILSSKTACTSPVFVSILDQTEVVSTRIALLR